MFAGLTPFLFAGLTPFFVCWFNPFCLAYHLFVLCFLCATSASLCLRDIYLHVPGLSDNMSHFSQRVDDPSLLPSHHRQVWGRAASLGSFRVMAVKDVLRHKGSREVKFSKEPLRLNVEADSLMLEWSKPLVVTVTKTLHHLRSQYKLFADSSGGGLASTQKGGVVSPQKDGTPPVRRLSFALPSLEVSLDMNFKLANTNVFVYGLAPGKWAVPRVFVSVVHPRLYNDAVMYTHTVMFSGVHTL